MKRDIKFKCPHCGATAYYSRVLHRSFCIVWGWLDYTDNPIHESGIFAKTIKDNRDKIKRIMEKEIRKAFK